MGLDSHAEGLSFCFHEAFPIIVLDCDKTICQIIILSLQLSWSFYYMYLGKLISKTFLVRIILRRIGQPRDISVDEKLPMHQYR